MTLIHRSYVSVDEVAELQEQDAAARAAANAGYDPLAGVPERYRDELDALDLAEPPALGDKHGMERDYALQQAFDEGDRVLVRYDVPADQADVAGAADGDDITVFELCEVELTTVHRGQDRVVLPSPEPVDGTKAYQHVLDGA